MKIKLQQKRYAVLIPSKGRPDALLKTLRAQPFLNRSNTYVGIERGELKLYKKVVREFSKIRWISYDNTLSSGTVAREELRKAATHERYQRYVVTDDNTRYSEESLENLVRASFVYPIQPCIVAGAHGTAKHFDKGRIDRTLETHKGLRFYKKRSAMFWALPHTFYSQMSYIMDSGCMDDVQVTFAAFDQRIFAQMVCLDAPFQKKRYQTGGYGNIGERVGKVGIAIQRFALSHPDYMEKVRVTFPWTQIEKRLLEGDSE
jgi:hypothetical protein